MGEDAKTTEWGYWQRGGTVDWDKKEGEEEHGCDGIFIFHQLGFPAIICFPHTVDGINCWWAMALFSPPVPSSTNWSPFKLWSTDSRERINKYLSPFLFFNFLFTLSCFPAEAHKHALLFIFILPFFQTFLFLSFLLVLFCFSQMRLKKPWVLLCLSRNFYRGCGVSVKRALFIFYAGLFWNYWDGLKTLHCFCFITKWRHKKLEGRVSSQ